MQFYVYEGWVPNSPSNLFSHSPPLLFNLQTRRKAALLSCGVRGTLYASPIGSDAKPQTKVMSGIVWSETTLLAILRIVVLIRCGVFIFCHWRLVLYRIATFDSLVGYE